MSFEWQDRDAAARTLGVETATLQAWIDDGRAPSRTYQGRLQVLIELLDDEEITPQPASTPAESAAPKETGSRRKQKAEAKKNGTHLSGAHSNGAHGDGAPTPAKDEEDPRDESGPEPEAPREATSGAEPRTTTDIELVARRELQLAGGMVAAWQRLAETSNQDLKRARKVGVLSWSLVAALAVLSAIGIWYATQSVTDATGRLNSTQEKLSDAKRTVDDAQTKASALQEEVTRRTQELAEANAKLAASIERANLTRSQVEQLAAQHLLTTQLAQKQAETSKSLIEALQGTLDEQKQRLASLEKELAAAAKREEALKKDVATRDETITQAAGERDALKKEFDQLTSDHAKAKGLIDDLQKQLTAVQAELDKSKTAKTND